VEQMREVNDLNWQWFVYWFSLTFLDIKVNPIPDMECIQIYRGVSQTCKILDAPMYT